MKRGGPLKRKTPLKAKTALKRGSSLKTGKSPRKTKTPLKKAKDKLWSLCKQIIRTKYPNVCYTCGKGGLEGANWHTGHFLTDATCSTELSYDILNLRPQCYHCNINLSGNWIAFEQNLIRDHGKKYVEELKKRNQATKGLSYRIDWYLAKIEAYETILKKYDS